MIIWQHQINNKAFLTLFLFANFYDCVYTKSGLKPKGEIMRRTKIIATMGPACESESVLEKMIKAGMNMARFNMSHGTHESHKKHIETIKKLRTKLGVSLPIMVDTKGPEIRIKQFKNGSVELAAGSTFVLTTRNIVGSEDGVSLTYKDFPAIVGKGTRILVNDGLIELSYLYTLNLYQKDHV